MGKYFMDALAGGRPYVRRQSCNIFYCLYCRMSTVTVHLKETLTKMSTVWWEI